MITDMDTAGAWGQGCGGDAFALAASLGILVVTTLRVKPGHAVVIAGAHGTIAAILLATDDTPEARAYQLARGCAPAALGIALDVEAYVIPNAHPSPRSLAFAAGFVGWVA